MSINGSIRHSFWGNTPVVTTTICKTNGNVLSVTTATLGVQLCQRKGHGPLYDSQKYGLVCLSCVPGLTNP